MPVPKRIPVAQPVFNGNEKKYVLDCLETGWISSVGKYVETFETKFASHARAAHAAPAYEFSRTITVGISPPPMGRMSRIPNSSDKLVNAGNTHAGVGSAIIHTHGNCSSITPARWRRSLKLNRVHQHPSVFGRCERRTVADQVVEMVRCHADLDRVHARTGSGKFNAR